MNEKTDLPRKKRLLQTVGIVALLLLVVGVSIGIPWAVLNRKSNEAFNVTYTARYAHAVVTGEYVMGNGEETEAASLGSPLTFNGSEPVGIEQKFQEKPNLALNTDEYLEFHYTIKNTSDTDGFGVTLQLSGLDNSNLQVKYSSSTRNTTEGTTAQYLCTRSSLSDLYVNPQGRAKSVLDIGIRISLIDSTKKATGTAECKIFLDSLAEEPKVGDLWQADSKTMHAFSFDDLLQKISGDEAASINNMSAIDALAQKKTTSAEMLENYQKLTAASSTGNFVSAMSNDSEIIIELGGLKWTPVYLSQDDQENDILTLWLVDNQQDAWAEKTATEGDYHGFIDGTLYSDWSANWDENDPTGTYPSNMYGTSYIRAVTLNNGGDYATSGIDAVTAEQSESNVFAMFTMAQYGLIEFLVTPEHVSWQESGQSVKIQIGDNLDFDCPNENWGDISKVPHDNYYENGKYNYAGKSGNDTWKNDYLWLPSLSETGCSKSLQGIWKTSIAQRGLNNSNVKGNVGIVGDDAEPYFWLRSGCYDRADGAFFLYPGSDWGVSFVGDSLAVRPALHLNLTAVTNSLNK